MLSTVNPGVGYRVMPYLVEGQQVSYDQTGGRQLSSSAHEVACLEHAIARAGWLRLLRQKIQPPTM